MATTNLSEDKEVKAPGLPRHPLQPRNPVSPDLSILPIQRWDEEVGNQEAKEAAIDVAMRGGKMFLAGPSGSGKSITINHACKLLVCESPGSREPCHHCGSCRRFAKGWYDTGLFAYHLRPSEITPVHMVKINCRSMTPTRLLGELSDIRHMEGIRVIHLEECKELHSYHCDTRLTEVMDDPNFEGCRWFATAVSDVGMEEQFRRRWNPKVQTARASNQEVAGALDRICKLVGVEAEKETLVRLAERAWGVIGTAVGPIDRASRTPTATLTPRMVELHPFSDTDPWQQQFFETV